MKKGMMSQVKKYNIEVKTNVAHVIDKYVDDQKDNFPSFSAAEFFRLAAVKYLKLKKYLDADKRYL